MIAHDFRYEAPETIEQALQMLSSFGAEAAVIGGGTWLVPNMTYGRHKPSLVLDTKKLGLDEISHDGADLFIGSRATYAQVLASTSAHTAAPLLTTMAGQITGGPQILGQGTLGGSACYGNPSSDVPACLLALGATLFLRSEKESRAVPAGDFFRAPFSTDRHVDEMLTGVRIPASRPFAISGFHKLKFSAGSSPIVTAACIGSPAGAGNIQLRIAVGGANEVPFEYEAIARSTPTESEISDIAQMASALVTSEWSDEFAGPGYRRRVAPAIVRRSILNAVAGNQR